MRQKWKKERAEKFEKETEACSGRLGGLDVDLLGGLRKGHASKGRRQGFRVHFAAGTLEIVILPGLRVRRLLDKPKHKSAPNHTEKKREKRKHKGGTKRNARTRIKRNQLRRKQYEKPITILFV